MDISSKLFFLWCSIQIYFITNVQSNNAPKLATCWNTPVNNGSTGNANCQINLINENLSVGTVFGGYTVTDDDADITFSITAKGNTDPGILIQYIAIQKTGPKSANLAIKSKMDYEAFVDKTLQFAVNLIDPVNSPVPYSTYVVLQDLNDNPPQFTNMPYRCNIPENSATATCNVIEIIDRDTDTYMSMNLSTTGKQNNPFNVALTRDSSFPTADGNRWTGVLSLNMALDYETTKIYDLDLFAYDGNSNKGQGDLVINVQDVEDTPPFFLQLPYYKSIDENTAVDTVVYTVQAQDGDTGINLQVHYSFEEGNAFNSYFSINPTTGVVTIAKIIDRESTDIDNVFGIIPLTIVAVEQSDPMQDTALSTSKTTLIITINDVNDYPPTFDQVSYTANVDENTQVGIPVFTTSDINVQDLDQGVNGTFTMSLKKNGQPFTIFSVTPTTVFRFAQIMIRVANSSALDFEKVQQLTFDLIATDNASPFLTKSVPITVNITNMNDNFPVFNNTIYNVNITENPSINTVVTQIQATDADAGVFGIIVYSIPGAPTNKFAVNPTTGQILVNVAANMDHTLLDRETSSIYYLTFMAQDNNGLSPSFRQYVEVVITLLDLNDNAPVFSKPIYDGVVVENSLIFLTDVQVQATDIDSGPLNNQFLFALDSSSTWNANFSINATSGQLSLKQPLDFELLPASLNGVIEINVKATDKGAPPLTSHPSLIRITVMDANDNNPIFVTPYYTASVNKTSSAGFNVIQVNATDADKPGSLQASVFYVILSGGANKFAIDGTTGWISVQVSTVLAVGQYNLTVAAYDRGIPQLSGQANVFITVFEFNNQAPYFDPIIYRASISENRLINTVVGKDVAFDADSNANLSYSIIKNLMTAVDPNGYTVQKATYDFTTLLSVDNSGSIFAVANLDREMTEVLNVPIQVVDLAAQTAGQTATGTFILTVLDLNDNAPQFVNSNNSVYVLSISESTILTGSPPKAYTSLTVQATDADKGNIITYGIIQSDPNTFSIDSQSGQISLVLALDREIQDKYMFNVSATDGNFTSLATVYVTVIDANDNAPNFTQFVTPLSVPENTEVGFVITQIIATDPDLGAFGTVEYTITSGGASTFLLNKTTGILTLNGPLDRESTSSYSLTIEANDNSDGTPQMKTSQIMTVIVTDINDNAPQFSKISYTFNNIQEGMATGETIGEVTAVDPDAGVNAQLVYSLIMPSSAPDLFSIKTVNQTKPIAAYIGSVVAKATIQGFSGCINATVMAMDGGNPPLNSSVPITFCIQEINKYAPNITNMHSDPLVLYLNESETGVVLFQVTAYDGDSGQNGVIRFTLVSTNQDSVNFTINATSGVLTNSVPLDREVQSIYRFQIKAYDLGNPQLASSANVLVEILDMNDNPPFFPESQRFVTLSFSENIVPNQAVQNGVMGSLIGNVNKAVDQDTGVNAQICYFILTNQVSTFYLNKFSGDLYALKSLDRETVSNYSLPIKAAEGSYCNSTLYEWKPASTRRRLLYLDDNPVPNNINDTSISFVTIQVADVNDNPPIFSKKFFFGGITLNQPPGSLVFDFSKYVSDADAPGISGLSYSIPNGVQISDPLKGQLSGQMITNPLLLNPTTGKLTTGPNVYFQSTMQGYFVFGAAATDGVSTASANVTIYLLSTNQQLLAVAWDTVANVGANSDLFAAYLSNLTGLEVSVDYIVTHQNSDGTADATKTDIYIHAVNATTHQVVSADDLLLLLDKNQQGLKTLYTKFAIQDIVKLSDQQTIKSADISMALRIALIVVAIVLCVIIIIVCLSMWICRRMYRRKLKAATAVAYGSNNSHSVLKETHVPGTNLHTYEGSNPMWMKTNDNLAYAPDHLSSAESDSGDLPNNGNIQVTAPRAPPVLDEQEITVDLYPDSDSGEGSLRYHRQENLLDAALDQHARSNGVFHSETSGAFPGLPASPPPAYRNGKLSNFYPSTAI